MTGLQKGRYSGAFSDKFRSDRPTTAEFRNQNVCEARREDLHPTKSSDIVVPSRTFSDNAHSDRLADGEIRHRNVCDTRRDYLRPANVSDTPARTYSENFHATSEMSQNPRSGMESSRDGRERSEAALFRRALIENRMPAPKQLEFDGTPKLSRLSWQASKQISRAS